MKQFEPSNPTAQAWQTRSYAWGWWLLRWLLVGCGLITLAFQLPVHQMIMIGRNDGGYVQGWQDADNRWGVTTDPSGLATPLRWTKAESYVIFPQLGAPATVTIHWRGWRPAGPVPTLQLLLNGTTELAAVPGSADWQTTTVRLTGNQLKPDDTFLTLRSDPPFEQDGVVRGIQVDRIELMTTGWPILPAPGQVLQGGLALMLAAAAIRRPRRILVAAAVGLLAWLLLYRYPLVGYPVRPVLRWLWLLAGTALLLQHTDRLRELLTVRRAHSIALLAIAGWLAVVLASAQAHTVLSTPGVEKDFRVFATRSNNLTCPSDVPRSDAPCVLRADGFYQFGYPFLLWLVRPLLHDNPFLAARWVGLTSGALLLAGSYLVGLRLLGPTGGLLTLLITALNALTVTTTLQLGTDSVFAAVWALAVAGLLWLPPKANRWQLCSVGALCGLAFWLRHPGIVLLPAGWAFVALAAGQQPRRQVLGQWGWLTLGFVLVALPQLMINTIDTGQPLYSQQAKNIWLAVYGNTDWGRWTEAGNDVHLLDLVRQEPGRFWGHWGHNLVTLLGTGAADPQEFGQAWLLRLLGFPANLLALGGLACWLWRRTRPALLLIGLGTLYTVAVAVSFLLARFFVPLIPILAAAAAGMVVWLGQQAATAHQRRTATLALGLVLAFWLAGEPAGGSVPVLAHQPPADQAIAAIIANRLPASATIVAQLAPEETVAKYSAVAHRFGSTGGYLLWSEHSGLPRPANAQQLAAAGQYHVYQIRPTP